MKMLTTFVPPSTPPDGMWCHSLVEEFNQGTFYLVKAQADGETITRTGPVMCHEV